MMETILMRNKPVRPHGKKLTDEDARHLLAAGLLRACHEHGPSRVALETGCDEKTIRRARDEHSTLGLACTFNLLDVDPTALDALCAAKGFTLLPLEIDFEEDMEVIAELSGLLNEWVQAMRDGTRTNSETKALATRIRHLMPKLRGITHEDDHMKLTTDNVRRLHG
jgi:hypothetical protein